MEWYREWFNEDYLRLYAHRDEDEAREQVAFLNQQLGVNENTRLLDLACGAGRHLIEFAKVTKHAVGLDLSSTLLAVASKTLSDAGLSAKLDQADMRELPYDNDTFDVVTCLFTSFGYFKAESDHLQVLKEASRVLKPGGTFLLDYINSLAVKKELPNSSLHEIANYKVEQHRRLSDDSLRVEKDIQMTDLSSGQIKRHLESVRLFTKDEVIELLQKSALRPVKIMGDFTGRDFEFASSRLIILSNKE